MKQLLKVEKISLAWVVLTSVLMVLMWPRLTNPMAMVWTRVEWLVVTTVLIAAAHRWPGRITDFLRCGAALGWLGVWYPETYELNRWRENLDHIFAQAEWDIFGCQPSLEMCRWLDGPVWSELFNLGYFSYFPMIFALMLTLFFIRSNQFKHVAALILVSFFLYYIIYIALPVTGPQFYFLAIGTDNAAAGIYPNIGTFFNTHSEMLPSPGWDGGLFSNLVEMTHNAGERPTAAFPSSHVGLSTIVLMLSWRHARVITPVLFPLWLLLCGATVYIQAHYVIDAIAGLITAPLALGLAHLIVGRLLSSSTTEESTPGLLTL